MLVIGSFPGLIFKPITNAMSSLGFEHINFWKMSILTNAWGDQVWIKYANAMFVVVFLVFFVVITIINIRRTKKIGVKDIANAGEPVRATDNYHFSEFFYQPFWRVISPVMKYRIETYYDRFAQGIEEFFQYFRRIYSGNGQTYAYYVIIFLAILLAVSTTLI